jgi:putative membrane protein
MHSSLTALWIAVYAGVLVWSSIEPYDLLTWLLETLLAMVGGAVLAATYQRFRLTSLTYTLILVHAVILMVGGHYTYAEVPLFNHLGELFGWQRNNYDKLGHLAQGFVPAIIAREILIRKQVIPNAAWRNFFIVCFCLALSAVYEMIEWVAVLVSAEAAESFLGTQGYVWDTQSDMAWALLGSVLALALLGRLHDRQLAALTK